MSNKTILIPTDFSKSATNAINYAIEMYGEEGCKFVLMHALNVPINSTIDAFGTAMDTIYENTNNSLKKIAAEVKGKLTNPNSKVEALVEVGVGNILLIQKAVKDVDADLIIMGTTGASGVEEILMGSNTKALISRTKVPVLAIPGNAHFKPLKNIVFALDYNQIEKEDALDPLKEVATKYDSQVILLHVKDEKSKEGIDKAYEAFAIHGELDYIDHEYDFMEGENVAEQIEKFVEENNADLLVTITRKHSLWERIFSSSVTGKLAMHTNKPLLVLHS